jgi:hypothetical protein
MPVSLNNRTEQESIMVNPLNEQILKANQAAFDHYQAVALASLEGLGRLADLNIQTARTAIEDSLGTIQQLVSAKDPKALAGFATTAETRRRQGWRLCQAGLRDRHRPGSEIADPGEPAGGHAGGVRRRGRCRPGAEGPQVSVHAGPWRVARTQVPQSLGASPDRRPPPRAIAIIARNIPWELTSRSRR